MPTFLLYIEDNRYSIPTLRIVTALHAGRVRELAEELMKDNEHHLGVEVFEDDKRLFGLGASSLSLAVEHG